MSPTTSIPTSPRPGKDPPATTAEETKAGPTEPSENTTNMNEDTGEVRNSEEKDGSKEVKDREAMPPPPSKTRPTIITQAPSTSNTLSSSRLQQASHLSAPHDPSLSQDQVAPQQPANFQGFFILVDDLKTKSTAHPHKIHYLFSDDDTSDLLTTSLLDNIPKSADLHTSLDEEEGEEGARSDHSSSSSSTFKSPHQSSRASTKKTKEAPPATKTKEERTIIIDISQTGDSITAVNSLTPNWQVMHAAVENAPNLDQDKDSEERKGGGGLMLKVEGIGGDAINGDYERGLGIGREGEKGMGEDEMRELMEGFDRKMGMLRKIAEGGKGKGEDACVS